MKFILSNKLHFFRYEIAVGSTPGGAQIQQFTSVAPNEYTVTLRGLDMLRVNKVFVTVKGYNGAGYSSVATSNGVFISRISAGLEPLQPSMVYDGSVHGRDL